MIGKNKNTAGKWVEGSFRLLIELVVVSIISVLIIPLLKMTEVEAAPGHLAVYRDSTNDTTIADSPSTTHIEWNTTGDVDGIYSLQANNYDIQLGESGHYLVLYSVHTEDDGGTNRSDSVGWIELDGTDSAYGYSSGYIRRTGGNFEGYNSGAGIIYANSGDLLNVEMQKRDSNSGTVARQRVNKSGISLLRLRDDWDYLKLYRNSNSSNVHSWTSFTDVDWEVSDEEDTTTYSWDVGTADEITLKGNIGDHFLVTANISLYQSASSSNRQNYEMRLALDGTGIDGTTTSGYIRGNQNSNGTYSAVTSYVGIITKQSSNDETLTVQLRRESTASATTYMVANETAVSIVKLPNLADYIRLTDFDGSQDLSITRYPITWDTTLEEDSSFTHNTTNTSRVDLNGSGDFLVLSSAHNDRPTNGTTREAPFLEYRIDGTDLLEYGGHGSFNRGYQSNYSMSSGSSGGAIINNLTSGQYIELTQINEAANDDSLFTAGGLGFQAVRIDSLFLDSIPYTSQRHFRWRDDTTALNTSGGWLSTEDDNSSVGAVEINETVRIRVEAANVGNDIEASARSYELQWGEKNGSCAGVSSWTGISDGSDEFEMVNTANITDGESTTTGLLANTESLTFINGEGKDTGDTTSVIGPLDSSEYTELEYSIRPTSSVSYGSSYCFRLYDTNNSTELDDYSVYPELTIGTPQTKQLHYRWRDDSTDLNTDGGWLASEDSSPASPTLIQANTRLRVEVANTGTHDEDAARTYELQYGLKSTTCADISSWTGVGDASDDFDMVASSYIDPDGETTSSSLLSNSEGYTYTNGEGRDVTDTSGSIGPLGDEYYTEIEYSFEPTVNATPGGTYCFRLYDTNAGEVLDEYSVYPEMTLVNPHTSQMHFRWRDDSADLNTNSGWIATEDSNPATTITRNSTYRLRLEIANSGDYIEDVSRTYELQWGEKVTTCEGISSWIGVSDTDDAIEMVTTDNIDPDGETTTALLSNSEGYTFVSGEGRDSADTTGTIGPLDTEEYTELEYSIQATDKATTGASYCFRVYDTNNSEVLDSYVTYPQLQLDYEVLDNEGLLMEWNNTSGVTDDAWTTINFDGNYTNPVFVCTVEYSNNIGNETDNDNDSVVCRVQNVTSTGAQIRLQEPGFPGDLTQPETVHWMVVEEGAYDISGAKLEAFTYTSTVTDSDSSWVGEAQTLTQTYTNPVAVGSITTYNDPLFTMFWSHDGSRNAATSTNFYTGKHVAEDPTTSRSDETISVIVFEETSDTLNGIDYEAQLQGQTIERIDDAHTNYSFAQPFSSTPEVALTSITGISGGNGGYVTLYDEGSGVMSSTNIYLVAMEEEVGDGEQNGATEHGPYVVFETAGSSFIALDQTNYQFFENNDGVQPGTQQAAENTPTTDVEVTEVIRLRMSVQAGLGDLRASDKSFKLQYGEGSDCSSIGTWIDVDGTGGTGIWRGYDNNSTSDGTTISSSLLNNDANTLQTYQEQNNSPVNPNSVSEGDWGEYDWVIQNNGATANTDYCFRMVTSDEDVINYSRYPQLTTSPVNYTQNDFEWFVPASSVTLSNVWPENTGGIDLNENEVLTQFPSTNKALSKGDQIRIQMNMTVSKSNLDASSQGFQLEYVAADDCTSASGWAAVGDKGSGDIWRLYDESTIGDSTSQVNQISTSDPGAEGYFSEVNPSTNNPNAVSIGETTEWDWPVENNGAAENTTYCFRMVLDDGTALQTYNADGYPKLTTAPGISNQLRHGKFYKDQEEKGFFWVD